MATSCSRLVMAASLRRSLRISSGVGNGSWSAPPGPQSSLAARSFVRHDAKSKGPSPIPQSTATPTLDPAWRLRLVLDTEGVTTAYLGG